MSVLLNDPLYVLQIAREKYERAGACNVYGLKPEERAEIEREYKQAQAEYAQAMANAERYSRGEPLQFNDPKTNGWPRFPFSQ